MKLDELQAHFQQAIALLKSEGVRPSNCRSCNALVWWVRTPAGKNTPVDDDGVTHFATCPNAKEHRKAKK